MTRRPTLLRTLLYIGLVLLTLVLSVGPAYSQQSSRILVITGHTGEASVIQKNGRPYVDLEMLAQMVNGALGYQGNRIVLTLPSSSTVSSASTSHSNSTAMPEAASASDSIAPSTALSRQFVNAAIETLGDMREWGSTLALTIKSGYPVGNAMTEYRGRAAKSFALANAAASTDSDRNGLQLLTNEFNNLQTWSNSLVQARNSMSAANLTLSQDALQNDPLSQKIVRCFHFLGPMLASGRFEDDGSCR